LGLAENLRGYEDKGGDPQKVIDRLVKSGDLPAPVKYNSKTRREMRRHPHDWSEGELREAGVWDEVKDVWEEEEADLREEERAEGGEDEE